MCARPAPRPNPSLPACAAARPDHVAAQLPNLLLRLARRAHGGRLWEGPARGLFPGALTLCLLLLLVCQGLRREQVADDSGPSSAAAQAYGQRGC